MTLSFIIRTTLNWGDNGSDDLSLWCFAVNHAAWLYNCISHCFSDITPIEMVTNIKSDHCNLMCTHVWVCLVYVLEAKLQGGKKLSKWNHLEWIDQFLGFMRHLHLMLLLSTTSTLDI